jgi:hypothetical protein
VSRGTGLLSYTEPVIMARPQLDRKMSEVNDRNLWSSGHTSWLQTKRSRIRFPALPHILSSSLFGTWSTQPL